MIYFILPLLLSGGCLSYVPVNNSPFVEIKDLTKLDGVYKNIGINGLTSNAHNTYIFYLSKINWSDDKTINKNKLSIKAISDKIIVKEGIFVCDKDFVLSSRYISLKSKWGIPQPVIGVGYQSSELGIDQNKNGKYKKNTTICGLFALLIPMFLTSNEEVRFKRISLDSYKN